MLEMVIITDTGCFSAYFADLIMKNISDWESGSRGMKRVFSLKKIPMIL